MIELKMRFMIPVEGWVQAQCECGWDSGKSVSGNRIKQAAADHALEDHGVNLDPRQFHFPPGAPE